MKKQMAVLGICFLLASPFRLAAQQPQKVHRIGYLSGVDPARGSTRFEKFRLALRELGYIEGQNIAIEYRYAEGKNNRLPALAAERNVRQDVNSKKVKGYIRSVMRIAIPDFVSSTSIPLIVAKDLGLFEEEGQDVDIVTIRTGYVQSLRDGAVDFSAGTAHHPLTVFSEWRGVKLLLATSQGTPWMLVMRAGLAKRGEIDAVRGRRIAADRGPDLVFKHLLRGVGIDIERDRVQIGPLPETEPVTSFGVAAGRALADGKVDGFWANVLGCELALHLGGGCVVIDTRRGDGPSGAGNYSFAALATTESKIKAEPERVAAVIRAVARAQSVIRGDPLRATAVAKKLFPAVEAELMGQILARDREFYRPSIAIEAVNEMNRFAETVGLLSSSVPYEQVVATQFRSLWSE